MASTATAATGAAPAMSLAGGGAHSGEFTLGNVMRQLATISRDLNKLGDDVKNGFEAAKADRASMKTRLDGHDAAIKDLQTRLQSEQGSTMTATDYTAAEKNENIKCRNTIKFMPKPTVERTPDGSKSVEALKGCLANWLASRAGVVQQDDLDYIGSRIVSIP